MLRASTCTRRNLTAAESKSGVVPSTTGDQPVCRDFCGRTLSGGKRYYVPEGCTMAGKGDREPEDGQEDPVPDTK